MGDQLRTGVVLQFAARRGVHGSGLGLEALRQTECLGWQPFAGKCRLNTVCNGGGKNFGPLVHRLPRDANLLGCDDGSSPEKLDGGCLVHAEFNHSCFQNATSVDCQECKLSPMDSFGKRLEHALKTRGVERQALANVLDISPQAISKMINSATGSMNTPNTAKAARYLQVSWYWLATGEGEMDNVEYPVAKREAVALANLRAIGSLDPATADRITGELGRIADGLRAQETLMPGKRTLPDPISGDAQTSGNLIDSPVARKKSA